MPLRDSCVVVYFSGKPTAPRNLRVTTVSKDSVSLAWDQPEHNGGSPVKRYVVEKADEKQVVFSHVGYTSADTRQFKVTKLLEGNHYKFRVAAENEFGLGNPTSLSVTVMDELPPGQLQFLIVKIGR